MMKEKHTFVICAYKESAYLEECVKSLKEQKKESNIIMVTSTPNNYIKNICETYNVELKNKSWTGRNCAGLEFWV